MQTIKKYNDPRIEEAFEKMRASMLAFFEKFKKQQNN